MSEDVRLEPWGADDLGLLERLLGDPAMMEHLAGPESAEKIRERPGRYLVPDSGQFAVVVGGERIGCVGYCRKLGFVLLGAEDFECPPGHVMRCNDWRLELF